MLDPIPEGRRARLAVWLYRRSHNHELGVRVAAACDGTAYGSGSITIGARVPGRFTQMLRASGAPLTSRDRPALGLL